MNKEKRKWSEKYLTKERKKFHSISFSFIKECARKKTLIA